jgi:hypothetical protein
MNIAPKWACMHSPQEWNTNSISKYHSKIKNALNRIKIVLKKEVATALHQHANNIIARSMGQPKDISYIWKKMNNYTSKKWVEEVKVITDGIVHIYHNAITVIQEFGKSWANQYTKPLTPPIPTPWFDSTPTKGDAKAESIKLTLPVSNEEFKAALQQLKVSFPYLR